MQFHERLYELRKSSGMTQNDLAGRLDVSRQAVSRWEMGTAMPDVENLIAMSELFSVSLDYLLKGQEGEQKPVDTEQDTAAKEPDKEKRGSWMLIPIALPFVALSLFLNGWLFEKDVLRDVGFWLLIGSLGVLAIGLLAMLIHIGLNKLKKHKK